jgi:hypothetical protein
MPPRWIHIQTTSTKPGRKVTGALGHIAGYAIKQLLPPSASVATSPEGRRPPELRREGRHPRWDRGRGRQQP